MNSDVQMLAAMAAGNTRWTAPRTAEEAEAILLKLARPFVSRPVRPRASSRSAQNNIHVHPRPDADDIQQATNAVRKFHAAYEAIPEALIIVNRDGKMTLVNSQMENMFGYAREELVGQFVEILVPERYREGHPSKRLSYFNNPHIRPMGAGLELFGRHRNGSEFPVELSLSPLETDAGPMVVSTIRDLSEKRKADAMTRRLEARYRTLVEGLPAVTFMAALDEGLNELYVSPQIETLLGFSQKEWLGNPILWYSQLHPDDRKRWHTEFAVTCSTGEKFNSIYRFYSRSGKVVWVHGEAKVVRDEQGHPLFLQGVAFDITQLKETEDLLRQLNQNLESRVLERTVELSTANESLHVQIAERERIEAEVRRVNKDLARAHETALTANRTKSQFLANMSHELRTPLNAIIGYSELLQLITARKKDFTYAADLERIEKAGKHLLTLINDVLDISKIEAGRMDLEMQVFHVGPLIDEICETIQPLVAKNANVLEVHVAEGLGFVEADPMRLKQCLLNLLSNACKFTEAGVVTFTVTQERLSAGEMLLFRVQDTGIGLSAEQAARLFQPFTQADASTTRKFGGTGLGLAITKKLCEAMGGSISMESRLGNGSVFSIRLPVFPRS